MVSARTSPTAVMPVASLSTEAQMPRPNTKIAMMTAPSTMGRRSRLCSSGAIGAWSSPPKIGTT